MGDHINKDRKFQSDKYPTCPPGKVPLSTKDPMAQDLLYIYAKRRQRIDAEFSSDLIECLKADGYGGLSEALSKLPKAEGYPNKVELKLPDGWMEAPVLPGETYTEFKKRIEDQIRAGVALYLHGDELKTYPTKGDTDE